MSRTVRFASTLLILAVLTCGSLGAWPLGLPNAPTLDGGGDLLTAVVEWIASILAPDHPSGGDTPSPESPPTMKGTQIDPHGGG